MVSPVRQVRVRSLDVMRQNIQRTDANLGFNLPQQSRGFRRSALRKIGIVVIGSCIGRNGSGNENGRSPPREWAYRATTSSFAA